MLGSPCKTCRAIRPPHADQPAAGGELAAHRLPLTNDPRVHPAYPARPRGRAGHSPTTSVDDGRVQTDASAGPAPPAPASSTRLRLRQTTSRAWTQRATTPTPAIPAVWLPAPPPRSRTSLRPDTADAATHKHRTPTPGAGQRTPGRSDARTGHWTSVPWTGKCGHWSLAPDTGHRTLAEDVDRLTKARPATGPPGPPRRATACWGRPTVFLSCVDGACGARQPMQARAVRPPSSAR